QVIQRQCCLLTTPPGAAGRVLAALATFGRVDPMQADPCASDLEGVAIDDGSLPGQDAGGSESRDKEGRSECAEERQCLVHQQISPRIRIRSSATSWACSSTSTEQIRNAQTDAPRTTSMRSPPDGRRWRRNVAPVTSSSWRTAARRRARATSSWVWCVLVMLESD